MQTKLHAYKADDPAGMGEVCETLLEEKFLAASKKVVMDLSCTTRQSTIQCFLQLLSYGIAYYLATENKSPTWRLLLQI